MQRVSLLAVCLVSLTGCAALIVEPENSIPKKAGKITARSILGLTTFGISELAMDDVKEHRRLEEFYASLNQSVGHMSYDDALARWGPPVSSAEGVNIVVATWGTSSTGTLAVPIGNMIYAAPVNKGWELRLTFDLDTQLLKSWNYQEW